MFCYIFMLYVSLKIIDDDIDVPHNINENELNEFLTAEDAPQVCGIVDDRPLSMRVDDYRKSDKWKLVGSDDELKETEPTKNSHKNKRANYDSDLSPSRNKNSDSDASPPRKTQSTVKRKSRFTDSSPPRKPRNDSSPPRRVRKKSESDASPPRRTRRNSDSDASPPRRTRKAPESDASPPRRTRRHSDSDASPPRRTRKTSNSDVNHTNSKIKRKSRFTDASPPRRSKKNSESDNSPPRKLNKNSDTRHEKHSTSSAPKKLTKTLDGKVAGLQSGKDLKIECVALKKREDDLFKNMSAEISGKDAAPILRDRKTGKKRDLEKEAIEEFEKQQIENAKKEKYDRWGKGLKQVEDRRDKIQEELHEMSKPLARYADDEDLEKYLKDQEREGDPMLQYIRKKKKDKAIASGDPSKLFVILVGYLFFLS